MKTKVYLYNARSKGIDAPPPTLPRSRHPLPRSSHPPPHVQATEKSKKRMQLTFISHVGNFFHLIWGPPLGFPRASIAEISAGDHAPPPPPPPY